jgi:birA, biotin-[acetyl-CoA-carboxylase] ligase region
LTEQKIQELLTTKYTGRSLFCFEKLNSTNDFLKDAAENIPNGSAAVTMDQLAGKGRRGHGWAAAKGQMAAISVLFKDKDTGGIPLSLISALAVTRTLNNLCKSKEFKIKWPNDIILYGKKVCGILCESKITDGGCITVCGIGVNLTQKPEFFKNAGIPHGASIKMLTGIDLEPEKVVAGILNSLEDIRENISPKEFFDEYTASCITIGRQVKAITPEGEIYGKAVGVNADGTLNIESGGKTIKLASSEVSVRGIMGYI